MQTILPNSIISHIKGVSIDVSDHNEDKLIWRCTNDGKFTVKYVYHLLALLELNMGLDWIWLWKVKGPEKIKNMLWLACRERLLTQVLRKKRGLSDYELCMLCLDDAKTKLHVFRDCQWAKKVWQEFTLPV